MSCSPRRASSRRKGPSPTPSGASSAVRKVVEPPGEAHTDMRIILDLAEALELNWGHPTPAEVMQEMAEVTPQYGGIDYDRLDAEGGLQWPCPDESHPGTPILHTDRFTRGKGEFAVIEYAPPAEPTDEAMPFVMGTGRHLWNFHTNTMTGHSPGLDSLNPEGYVEISPEDAQRLGVCDGDALEIESRRGAVVAPARIAVGVKPGVIFMPFHFADAPANALTSSKHLDPQAKIPGLKTTAVSVKRVGEAPSTT